MKTEPTIETCNNCGSLIFDSACEKCVDCGAERVSSPTQLKNIISKLISSLFSDLQSVSLSISSNTTSNDLEAEYSLLKMISLWRNCLSLEDVALDHGLCSCDEAFKSRNMYAPDCPYHSFAVSEAMEAYASQFQSRIKELEDEIELLKNKNI